MKICTTLASRQVDLVDFDPTNCEHVNAFKMLCLGTPDKGNIKQHPTLRFKLDHPYKDVRAMMFHKVGEAFVKNTEGAHV